MDTISVVLCSYNGEKYIEEQLRSIIQQTYSNLEIIIQDDCSTDKTLAIAYKLQEQEPRIMIFRNEENLGFNRNFELAIQRTNGQWIALADQDDIWHPEKISRMVEQYDGTSLLMHCDSVPFRGTPDYTFKRPLSYTRFSGKDVRKLFIRNTVEGHTILFHRSLFSCILPFPKNVYFDWWIAYCAALQGGVQWVRDILVWRRMHENNATNQKESPLREITRRCRAFMDYPGTPLDIRRFGEVFIRLLEEKEPKALFLFLWKQRKLFFFFTNKRWRSRISHFKRIREFLRELERNEPSHT